jgi:hypothetical protein
LSGGTPNRRSHVSLEVLIAVIIERVVFSVVKAVVSGDYIASIFRIEE